MERRALLKQMALLGFVGAIPFKEIWARKNFRDTFKRPFHRFKLGELELTVITDGHIALSPVQPNFPNGEEQAEKELLRNNFRSDEMVDLSMNVLVIRKGKEVIVIDTGTGNSFGPASGWLMSSLKDADINAEAVTAIIVSHGHPDHVGGLLTKEDKPAFPNAQVYVSKKEHAFWMAATQDFSKSKFQDKKLMAMFTAGTQKAFRTLQSRIHLFEDGAELLGCLRMELAPGHTPGHTLTHIYSGDAEMIHVADLLHSDILSFSHPEWGFNGDTDIDQATATRKKVLATLAEKKTQTFGYHLPWPGIGHVRKSNDTYEWVADAYAFPG